MVNIAKYRKNRDTYELIFMRVQKFDESSKLYRQIVGSCKNRTNRIAKFLAIARIVSYRLVPPTQMAI